MMVWILVLQALYGLSDEQAEYQMRAGGRDRVSMRTMPTAGLYWLRLYILPKCQSAPRSRKSIN